MLSVLFQSQSFPKPEAELAAGNPLKQWELSSFPKNQECEDQDTTAALVAFLSQKEASTKCLTNQLSNLSAAICQLKTPAQEAGDDKEAIGKYLKHAQWNVDQSVLGVAITIDQVKQFLYSSQLEKALLKAHKEGYAGGWFGRGAVDALNQQLVQYQTLVGKLAEGITAETQRNLLEQPTSLHREILQIAKNGAQLSAFVRSTDLALRQMSTEHPENNEKLTIEANRFYASFNSELMMLRKQLAEKSATIEQKISELERKGCQLQEEIKTGIRFKTPTLEKEQELKALQLSIKQLQVYYVDAEQRLNGPSNSAEAFLDTFKTNFKCSDEIVGESVEMTQSDVLNQLKTLHGSVVRDQVIARLSRDWSVGLEMAKKAKLSDVFSKKLEAVNDSKAKLDPLFQGRISFLEKSTEELNTYKSELERLAKLVTEATQELEKLVSPEAAPTSWYTEVANSVISYFTFSSSSTSQQLAEVAAVELSPVAPSVTVESDEETEALEGISELFSSQGQLAAAIRESFADEAQPVAS